MRGMDDVVARLDTGVEVVVSIEYELTKEIYGEDADGNRGEHRLHYDIIDEQITHPANLTEDDRVEAMAIAEQTFYKMKGII